MLTIIIAEADKNETFWGCTTLWSCC